MDALFVVVAELLIVPLILWALMAIDLTVGVLTSIVAVLLGRRSATEALHHRWLGIRRRLLWSVIFLSAGLLLADIVFFDTLVSLALDSADEREDLDVDFAEAEGSFILGRVELRGLEIVGRRGGADPSARFEIAADEAIIDIDTAALLSFDFAVEAIELEGVHGTWDRLRAVDEPRREAGFELDRQFVVDRLHVGALELTLRDHTRPDAEGRPRELPVIVDELDMGPLRSDAAIFDLLYRTRGRGSVAGYGFELLSVQREDRHESTLELDTLPLDAIAEPLERSAGIKAGGTASLTLVNRYHPGPPEPEVELDVSVRLESLALEAGEDASMTTKVMLRAAAGALEQLGGEFPLEFAVTVRESELAGLRSLAESGLIERISDAMTTALKDELQARARPGASKP